jgi:flagellin
MTIRINHNFFSALVQKHLTQNSRTLEQSFERISSGVRINSAADDPTGLATSERFRYEIQGVRQNQQNVSTALSLIGTAESHSNGIIDMLQRARELSIQAGNDSLNAENKQVLQRELDQLMQEIDRIAATARFGDRYLFNGGFQSVRIQVGPNQSEYLTMSLGDYRTNVLGTGASITSANPVSGAAMSAGQVKINGVDVPATAVDGLSTLNPAASAEAKIKAINLVESQTGVHAMAVPAEQTGVAAVQAGMLDISTNTLTINGILIPPTAFSAGDAGRSLQTAINQHTSVSGVEASIDPGGVLKLTAIDGRNVEIETTGNAAQLIGLSASAGDQTFQLAGKVELTASSPFTVEDPAGLIGLGASQQVLGDPSSALIFADITTAAGVEKAIRSIDTALEQLNGERSRLGVISKRLETMTETLARQVEDLAAADSRIRDTDFALETARMTQAQILQEASLSMLTQANIAPRRALELLQG